jgi:hypothetical protein
MDLSQLPKPEIHVGDQKQATSSTGVKQEPGVPTYSPVFEEKPIPPMNRRGSTLTTPQPKPKPVAAAAATTSRWAHLDEDSDDDLNI